MSTVNFRAFPLYFVGLDVLDVGGDQPVLGVEGPDGEPVLAVLRRLVGELGLGRRRRLLADPLARLRPARGRRS